MNFLVVNKQNPHAQYVTEHWIVLNAVNMFWGLETDLFRIDEKIVTLNAEAVAQIASPHFSCIPSLLTQISHYGSVLRQRCSSSEAVGEFLLPRIKQHELEFDEILQNWATQPDTTLIQITHQLSRTVIPKFENFIMLSQRVEDVLDKELVADFVTRIARQTFQLISGQYSSQSTVFRYVQEAVPQWKCVLQLCAEIAVVKPTCRLSEDTLKIREESFLFESSPFDCVNMVEVVDIRSKQILEEFIEKSRIIDFLELVGKIAFFDQSDFVSQFIEETDSEISGPHPREHEIVDLFHRAIHACPGIMHFNEELINLFTVGFNGNGWDGLKLQVSPNMSTIMQFVITSTCLHTIRRISKLLINIVLLNYRLGEVYRATRRRKLWPAFARVLWQMSSCMHSLVKTAHELIGKYFHKEMTTHNISSLTQLRDKMKITLEETEYNLINLINNWKQVINLVEKYVGATLLSTVDDKLTILTLELGGLLTKEISKIVS